MKKCRVSFENRDGIEHACEVEAETLFEAVGFALARLEKAPDIDETGQRPIRSAITVEVREPTVTHRVERSAFDAWLARKGGRSPREIMARRRVLEAMGLPTD